MRDTSGKPVSSTIVALAADHGGWRLKEDIREFLLRRGLEVADHSRPDEEPVDYADVGLLAAGAVSAGSVQRAILICGTGLGMCILANKLPGVRACLCHESYSARMSRAHNNCNILVLGGRVIGPELAKEVVSVWLDTPFEGGRHELRLAKIHALEMDHPHGTGV
jgi:ribose 5-phosphate isomerase B